MKNVFEMSSSRIKIFGGNILKRYFINNGNIDVHITEWGSKNNPVIFCLHGLGSTSLSFIEIAEQLKAEYRLISIDVPDTVKLLRLKVLKNMKCLVWQHG